MSFILFNTDLIVTEYSYLLHSSIFLSSSVVWNDCKTTHGEIWSMSMWRRSLARTISRQSGSTTTPPTTEKIGFEILHESTKENSRARCVDGMHSTMTSLFVCCPATMMTTFH